MGRGASDKNQTGTRRRAGVTASAKLNTADIYSASGSRELMLRIKEALAAAGLPRTSTMTGGEITGLTSTYGSTGFSVRPDEDGKKLNFNVVISGEAAGVRYRHFEELQGDDVVELHEPVDPEILYPKITAVFKEIGLEPMEIAESGYQLMWDDDIEYKVVTRRPRRNKKAEGEAIRGLAANASYRAPARFRASKDQRDRERAANQAYQQLRAVPPALLTEHLSSTQLAHFSRRARDSYDGEAGFWAKLHRDRLRVEYPIN